MSNSVIYFLELSLQVDLVKRAASPTKKRSEKQSTIVFCTFIFKEISFPGNVQNIIFPK